MLRPRLAFPALAALAALATPLAADPSAPLRPPVARKDPHKIEIHGDTLVDDYYWMRNKGTPEVESHLRAELAYSDAFMKPTAALQRKLYDEMLSRIQQTDTNVPARDRGFFYYSRTEEGKQYPLHARRKGSLDAPEAKARSSCPSATWPSVRTATSSPTPRTRRGSASTPCT